MPCLRQMELQPEIQWETRSRLLDFLIDVHQDCKFAPETFFLTVNLLDRYCSRRIVTKDCHLLTACVSLLVAAKYVEQTHDVPTILKLRKTCRSLCEKHGFSEGECLTLQDGMLCRMELAFLTTLDWSVGHPTAMHLLRATVPDESLESGFSNLAQYILEATLYHKDFVCVLPSILVASAMALAHQLLRDSWPSRSRLPQGSDTGVMTRMFRALEKPSYALYIKYAGIEHSEVSVMLGGFLQPQRRM